MTLATLLARRYALRDRINTDRRHLRKLDEQIEAAVRQAARRRKEAPRG